MKKTLKQLEEENADIINDKILQEICEWGSPVDNLKDEKPFDEEEYLERAKINLEKFKDKCEKALKLFDDNLKPKYPTSELRKGSNIKFKENPKDIPPYNFNFQDKMAVESAYQAIKKKYRI